MSIEAWVFDVTVPAGTPKAAPVATAMTMPDRVIDEVEFLVPPGPRGEVGFQLAHAGTAVVPRNPGKFIVTDNEVIRWTFTDLIDTGAWQLIAYNTGAQPHTITVRFLVRLPAAPVSPFGTAPLAIASISP